MSPRDIPKGHPKGLYVLFFAEMWERFCYYGMRALLTLYLTKALLLGDEAAISVYGAYTALVYAAPVAGGKLADKILGYRRAVILGGALMAIGEFIILGSTESSLYLGMGFIIVGNGYFKANISSIVGRLYEDGDPRRDSGFTIFYMGINVGALLATTVCAWVGETYGYPYGFGLAGIGMLLGIGTFIAGRSKLEGHGEPPDPEWLRQKVYGIDRQSLTILLSLLVVPILYFLVQQKQIVDLLLVGTLVYVCGSLVGVALRGGDRVQRDRIFVLMILMVFNVVFWACFEQAGTSLTLFADRNVDREVFGWNMPASVTQSFNPFFIITFGSLFSWMWVRLDRVGLNPSIPRKFALGIIQLGAGFLLVVGGAGMAGVDAREPLFILVFMYMLHTTGELFISPIGLSMVTKLAPKSMTGAVMGAWFLSFAFSNSLAASLAQFTGAGGDGGEEAAAAASPQDTLATYVEVFGNIGYVTVGIGLFLLLLSGRLNKMMHGVK